MKKKIQKTNPRIIELIEELNKKYLETKKPFWKKLADSLSKSTRRYAEVNLWKIKKYLKEDEVAIVPGKVLSDGDINNCIIFALGFSKKAKEKIQEKGGKALLIEDLLNNDFNKKIRFIV